MDDDRRENGIIMATIKAIKKRPFIVLLIGILMLAAAVFNAFIPLVAMIFGIVNMTGSNFFDSVLSILHLLTEPGNIPTIFVSIALLAVLVSIAAALLLPGYLMVVDDGLSDGEKKKNLFLDGIKHHFFRFFLITLRTVLFAVAFALFLLVASVPAIIVSKAAFTTKPDLLMAAVFIDIVTVGILFLSSSFFKVYVYMWYIAASTGVKNPFRTGKAIADEKFWNIAFSLLAFDVVFAAALYLIYTNGGQIFRYVASWFFATVFFTVLAVYLVNFYREGSGRQGS